MNYIQSHLQEGETVVMRITRMRGAAGGLAVIAQALLLTVAAVLLQLVAIPFLATIDPADIGAGDGATLLLSAMGVLLLLFVYGLMPLIFVLDVIRRFTAEAALTDRRVFGRGGTTVWSRFDIPLEELLSVRDYRMLRSLVGFLPRTGRLRHLSGFQYGPDFAQVVGRALVARDVQARLEGSPVRPKMARVMPYTPPEPGREQRYDEQLKPA